MGKSLEPYVIRPGDYLSQLAVAFGFDARAIWDDPKNEKLKRLRRNPNILAPGDVVYFPRDVTWLSGTAGQVNTFVAAVPRVRVAIRFLRDGKPLAAERYVLIGVDDIGHTTGTTDSDGCVHVAVPTTLASFRVLLFDLDESHEVRVGHLDPASEPSGARARLGLLGFYGRAGGQCQIAGPVEELALGLRAFQIRYQLPVTEKLDKATIAKLVDVFGS